MPLPHPIPERLLSLTTRRFHLLAEPMRLRLLDRLRDGEATVQQVADELQTSQQNVSKHLVLLTDASILVRRKDGTHVDYRIDEPEVMGLCEWMCGSVEHQLQSLTALVDELGEQPTGAPNDHAMH